MPRDRKSGLSRGARLPGRWNPLAVSLPAGAVAEPRRRREQWMEERVAVHANERLLVRKSAKRLRASPAWQGIRADFLKEGWSRGPGAKPLSAGAVNSRRCTQ